MPEAHLVFTLSWRWAHNPPSIEIVAVIEGCILNRRCLPHKPSFEVWGCFCSTPWRVSVCPDQWIASEQSCSAIQIQRAASTKQGLLRASAKYNVWATWEFNARGAKTSAHTWSFLVIIILLRWGHLSITEYSSCLKDFDPVDTK